MTNRTHNQPRFRIAVGVAVATAIGFSALGVASVADSQPATPASQRTAVDLSGVAAWAGTTGLSGLSPASVSRQQMQSGAVDLSDVADWARAEGLTGLSPASLAPAEGS